jgi:hypothetical protein
MRQSDERMSKTTSYRHAVVVFSLSCETTAASELLLIVVCYPTQSTQGLVMTEQAVDLAVQVYFSLERTNVLRHIC